MSFYSNLPFGQNENRDQTYDGSLTLFPALFEIISAQEVDALLPASVRYILVRFWISRHPNRLAISVNNYFEEWFSLALRGAVEWYHLREYNTTLVDKFYGLQRFNGIPSRTILNTYLQLKREGTLKQWPRELQLSRSQRIVVWIQKVIIPYLVTKLDRLCQQWNARFQFSRRSNGAATASIGQKVSNAAKFLLLRVYPLIKKIGFLLDLAVQLAFLSGKVGSTSLLNYIFGISYTRITLPMEHSRNSRPARSVSDESRIVRVNKFTILSSLNKVLDKTHKVLLAGGSQAFPTLIFLLRIYQWWVAEDLSKNLLKGLDSIDKEIPRPPNMAQALQDGDTCPVCKDSIQNPCVLETGIVACYPCAINYLRTHEGRCPVTGQRLIGCKFDESTNELTIIDGVRKLLI